MGMYGDLGPLYPRALDARGSDGARSLWVSLLDEKAVVVKYGDKCTVCCNCLCMLVPGIVVVLVPFDQRFASGGSARSCLPLPGCQGDQPVDPARPCVVVASIFVHAAVHCTVYIYIYIGTTAIWCTAWRI